MFLLILLCWTSILFLNSVNTVIVKDIKRWFPCVGNATTWKTFKTGFPVWGQSSFLIFWQIFHNSGKCFWLRSCCNFIPTVNRLTLLGKKKCCPVSILNLFFEIQSHVYMIVYSRSAAGWFIILIFHGRIMFITIGKKNIALFLF